MSAIVFGTKMPMEIERKYVINRKKAAVLPNRVDEMERWVEKPQE